MDLQTCFVLNGDDLNTFYVFYFKVQVLYKGNSIMWILTYDKIKINEATDKKYIFFTKVLSKNTRHIIKKLHIVNIINNIYWITTLQNVWRWELGE